MNENIQTEALSLIETFMTLQLGTVTPDGHPEVSYSPYIRIDGEFYIFISELASHTKNLKSTPRASLFFIEDEGNSKNLFARKRINIAAISTFIDRSNEQWKEIMTAFTDKHGPTMQVLMGLPDFHLVALEPQQATYVKGFGQAFRLQGKQLDLIEQINGK